MPIQPTPRPKRTPELTSKFQAEWESAMLRAPKAVKVGKDEYVNKRYALLGVL